MELILIHLLTHEIPMLCLGVVSMIFGKRAVLSYVRKHDPKVQELRKAAEETLPLMGSDAFYDEEIVRLRVAINAIKVKK